MINSIQNCNIFQPKYSENKGSTVNLKAKVFEGPNFNGVTNMFANSVKNPRPFVMPCDFEYFINRSNSKIVGKPPKDFINLVPGNPRKVFDMLNAFSDNIKHYDEDVATEKFNSELPQEKSIKINELGNGSFGKVFRFNFGKNSYAVKVITDKGEDKNGFNQEVCAGLYTFNSDFKDLAKFHFADIQNGWSVFEYIDEDVALEKEKQRGLSIEDDKSLVLEDDEPRNRVGGVRVDFGGIIPSDFSQRMQGTGLSDIKNSISDRRLAAYSRLAWIKKEDRFTAYLKAMEAPELRPKLAKQIWRLKEEDKLAAFKEAIKYQESQLIAVTEIEELNPDDQYSGFVEALKYPRLRGVAAAQIYVIDEKHRFNAYMNAMQYPESRESAASQIWSIEDDDQILACQEAMKYPESIDEAKKMMKELM